MNSRNPENRRSSIVSPARDARSGLCARITRGVRAAQGNRAALGTRAARGAGAGLCVLVSLGARGTQVNLSAGTAETLEENS